MSGGSTLFLPLRGFLLQLGLFSPECFQELLIKFNFGHSQCLKAVLSKGLGLAIVVGSALVKLPQILKIAGSGSAEGLSLVGILLELMAVTANGAYSFSQQFPFSAYGEAVFLSLQTSLIALLVLWFSGRTLLAIVFSVVYGAVAFAVTQPGMVPEDVLWFGQAANIPMVVVGKMIQVLTNYRNGHTGQLSAITVFLLAAGSLARIFTSIQETGDNIVILTYICSSAVNVLLAAQVIWYWKVSKATQQQQKKKSGQENQARRKNKPKRA